MKKLINTKTNDFKELIESKSLYVDKTLFIKELIDNPSQTICLLRPRKFGKSLNMSMLDYYFNLEYKGNTLFDGLKIMEQVEKYSKEMNKYPFILISFRDLKADTYQDFLKSYKELIGKLYLKYEFLLESDKLYEIEKEDFRKIIKKEEDVLLEDALSNLLAYLNKYYGEKVIVLLDEYDTPIFHAYEMGYYDEMKNFIGQLFEITFKGNNNLKRGIITGIIGMIFGDIFGGANNINFYNLTDARYSTYFGFTENEVKDVLKEYNLLDNFDEVKKWYGGYLFDETIMYNPVSILNYLEKKKFDSYWSNIKEDKLIKNLIYNPKGEIDLLREFEYLINNGYKERVNIDLYVNLKSLEGDPNAVLTLFMLTGYLTPTSSVYDGEKTTLRIPNLEVKKNFDDMATSWFKDDFKGNIVFNSLIKGEINEFKTELENIVLETFSYIDVPYNTVSEAFYHAFVMGLLRVDNDYYEVTSNREPIYGRYDVILKPKVNNIPAYIIEFKLVRDNSNFDETIETAFKQIEEMKYEVSVKDYDKVIKMAIAFKGKKLRLETR